MSVIRPKPPEDPIRYDPAAVFAAGAVSRQAFEQLARRLEASRAEAVAHPCAVLPERLLEAYGTRRPESELFAVLRTARRIREAVDRVVVLGCDRFVAGPRAIVEACCHPYHNELCRGERGGRPRLSFDGFEIDNDLTQGLLDLVAPHGRPRSDDLLDRWALVVVGGDAAPSVAATIPLFTAALAEAVGGDTRRVADRVVSIAGWPAELVDGAGLVDTFDVPAGLSPIHAVLSAAGLLPASIVGIDVVRLLEGAAAMNRRFREAPPGDNPALDYAAVAHLVEADRAAPAGGLSASSRQLSGMVAWHALLRVAGAGGQAQGGARDPLPTKLVVHECRRDRLPLPPTGPLTGDRDAMAAIDLPRIDEHAVGQLLQMLMLASLVADRLPGG